MLEALTEIICTAIAVLGCHGLCKAMSLGVNCFAINTICKHPELSDSKVMYMTKMVSKDKN